MDGPFGRRFPLVALAWENLTRQKTRTALAMAGIMIGVIAITSLGMFGATFEQSLRQSFDTAASTVFVTPGEDLDVEQFDEDHVAEIRRYTDESVYPVRFSASTVRGVDGSEQATVKSVERPGDFVDARTGRIPDPWRSGALVGATLADSLDVRPGDSIVVDDKTIRVRAVLEANSQTDVFRTDESVILPAERINASGFSQVLVRTDSPPAAFETGETLRASLNGREERYEVQDLESAIEQFNEQIGLVNTFLLAVGAVSLLVAAISILNVMLMSTIERRGEIGVLRAVGYQRLDVLRLMLTEAVLLGVVGAIVGVVLSFLLGMFINAELLGEPWAFSDGAAGSAAQGFLFGTGASLVSGLYPAWKAANQNPVEALGD